MKIEKTSTKTARACLKKIKESTFTAKNGTVTTIIIVCTDKGNFTNFKSVWEQQKIDASTLSEGDELEIVYAEYEDSNKGKTYKNFYEIEVKQ